VKYDTSSSELRQQGKRDKSEARSQDSRRGNKNDNDYENDDKDGQAKLSPFLYITRKVSRKLQTF